MATLDTSQSRNSERATTRHVRSSTTVTSASSQRTAALTSSTTHYLDEADALADRVVVIDGGRVIADGSRQALKSELVGALAAAAVLAVGLTVGTKAVQRGAR